MAISKLKQLVLTDTLLVVTFLGVAITGLGLHLAWHNHMVNTIWRPLHLTFALLSLGAITLHVHQHWGWYKALVKRSLTTKNAITTILAVMFLVVATSGFLNFTPLSVGLIHYKVGLIFIAFLAIHLSKRAAWLISSISKLKNA